MDGGNDPPQFPRAGQNIAATAILLHGLPEPDDPQEQAIHRNLRALVETAAVQQAESSASRHRLAASLPTRGMGAHQSNHSIRSPLQSSGVEQEATAAIINSAELPQLRNSSTPAVPDYNKPTSSTAFHPLEETKVVGIGPTDLTKTVWIGTQLSAK